MNTPPPALLLLGALFVAVSLAVWLGAGAIERRGRMRQRFRGLQRQVAPQNPVSADTRTSVLGWIEPLGRFVAPLAKLSMPSSGESVSALRRKMNQAGWRAQQSLIAFIAARTLLTLLLPVLSWFALGVLTASSPSSAVQAALLLAAAALGYLLPGIVLDLRVARRQREIFEALPDALDLLLVCVEAGLGLDMAIQRVATELRWRSPALAEEFDLVSADCRAGAARHAALQKMSTRVGIDEVTGFVAMLGQADRFGTSIGDALRVQADAMRTARRLRAQEQAAKVPVKLLFPLVFFIFPSLFTVLLGPATIRIFRVLLPTLQSSG